MARKNLAQALEHAPIRRLPQVDRHLPRQPLADAVERRDLGRQDANRLVVAFQLTAHQDQLTRVVPFADLSLATRDGRHVLIHRVSVAVYEVCPKHDYWGMELDAATCREYAWAGAQPQIKRAFDKAASGAPMAMSLEVTGVIGK